MLATRRVTLTGALLVAVTVAGCAARPPDGYDTAEEVTLGSPATAANPANSTALDNQDHIDPAQPTPIATIVFRVPPLPADLSPTRPPPTATGPGGDDDGGPPLEDADVAVAWVAALYIARSDTTSDLESLDRLAADPEIATNARATASPLDVDRNEARWPIITATTDVGDGWWRIDFVLKRTFTGQVGPATTSPQCVAVHVVDGRVGAFNFDGAAP